MRDYCFFPALCSIGDAGGIDAKLFLRIFRWSELRRRTDGLNRHDHSPCACCVAYRLNFATVDRGHLLSKRIASLGEDGFPLGQRWG